MNIDQIKNVFNDFLQINTHFAHSPVISFNQAEAYYIIEELKLVSKDIEKELPLFSKELNSLKDILFVNGYSSLGINPFVFGQVFEILSILTLSKEDYGTLSDLAKKQIASEKKESKLTAEVKRLKKKTEEFSAEKERLTEQNAELRKENGELQSVYGKIAIAKLRSEQDNLQRKLDRVMEFIKDLGLAEKLQVFINPNKRLYK